MKPKNLPDSILHHLQSHPGKRFSSADLATVLGCERKRIGHALIRLVGGMSINKEGADNRRRYWVDATPPHQGWYRPPFKPYRPGIDERMAAYRAEQAQYPSGPSGAAQEMSELDRNKLAMIGSSN